MSENKKFRVPFGNIYYYGGIIIQNDGRHRTRERERTNTRAAAATAAVGRIARGREGWVKKTRDDNILIISCELKKKNIYKIIINK